MANEEQAGVQTSAFTAVGKSALAKAGLAGKQVEVSWDGRALALAGGDGGSLRVTLAEIERLRLGYFQGKHRRVFTASLWRLGDDAPLVIEPLADAALGYGEAMRGLSAALAAGKGIDRIKTGIGGAAALMMLAFLMLPPVGIAVLALIYMEPFGWLARAVALAVAALLAASGIWLYLRRQRPMPVTTLDDLAKQLPDRVTGA